MNKTHVLKNEKDHKLKKIHMKSILCEVKNKTIIEDLDTLRKYNESNTNFNINIQNYKPNWKQWQTPRLTKRVTARTNTFTTQKQEKQQKSKGTINQNSRESENDEGEDNDTKSRSDCDQKEKQNKDNMSSRKSLMMKRKSSKIQLQLNQIVKYSLMYPSRNNSQKIIEQNIEKLINKSYELGKAKSRFSTIPTRSIRPTKITSRPKTKIDENMFLKIVEGHPSQQMQQEALKSNQTKHLLKKSRALFLKNKTTHDYSLINFIQKQINKLKTQTGRNTVSANTSLQYFEHNNHPGFDIREENLIDVHRFIRGQTKNDQQLSNYVTTKEIKKFQNKYDIYENIYKKTKDEFNNLKLDWNQMKQLTFKNAIFLNEAYMQCNNRIRRKEIQKVMANLRLYN